MDTRGADIVGQITEQLSHLLGRAISQVQSIDQDHASITILKVSLLDADQNQYPLVLKRQDDDGAYRLYRQYLEPYHLNSPRNTGMWNWMGNASWSWTTSGIDLLTGPIAVVI